MNGKRRELALHQIDSPVEFRVDADHRIDQDNLFQALHLIFEVDQQPAGLRAHAIVVGHEAEQADHQAQTPESGGRERRGHADDGGELAQRLDEFLWHAEVSPLLLASLVLGQDVR